MLKLLHTADVHLDAPLKSLALRDESLRARVQTATRIGFTRIVDAALSEGVAALLIAGDLFDGQARSARTGAFLLSELDRLRAAGIKVFYIKGNHDAENPITGDLQLPDNVHVFDGRGGKVELCEGVFVHGVSFTGKHASESLLPKFRAPEPGAVNIALLHSSLAGAQGHDDYAPCSLADLAGAGFDYWALGHIHKRQVHAQDPWIVMPGIPQGRDIGEDGPKSATLLRIDDEGVITTEEVPTSTVEFGRVVVEASTANSPEELRDAMRAGLAAFAGALTSETALVRVRFTGATALHWQILRDRETWAETARRMAEDTGRLWIDKLEFALSEPLREDGGTSEAASTELARLMAEFAASEAFAEEAREAVEAVLGELPAERRRALMPTPEALSDLGRELAEQGRERVMALLRGALT